MYIKFGNPKIGLGNGVDSANILDFSTTVDYCNF